MEAILDTLRKKAGIRTGKRIPVKKIILTALLVAIGLTMVFPLLWMVSSSFKFESDIFEMPIRWIPKDATLSHYKTVWQEFPYASWYTNTIKVTVLSVLFAITSSSLAGYAFARIKFKGSGFLLLAFIATLMIPMQVRLIPQYIMYNYVGLYDTHMGLALPWIFNGFSIFLLRQFYMGIPFDLSEAAKIDGCSEFQIFYKVVLPLTKPALMAIVIIIFTWSWNNYLGPLVYISSVEKQLLSVGVRLFAAEYSENYGAQMAGASMALIPIIGVYLIAQKSFIEGIALSGVKG